MSEALRIRIEELEEENRQLREMLFGAGWEPPHELRLSRSEAVILQTLVNHERCSHELLRRGTLRPGDEDNREYQIISVHIFKLRRKLKPYGIEIETLWGQGYCLSQTDRQRLLNWNEEARRHAST